MRNVVLFFVLAFCLAGCGSDNAKTRRDAVNGYLDRVSKAQLVLVGRQAQLSDALQRFSLTRSTPKELRQLREGRGEVAATLVRVRALDPPKDAKRLDALIVQRLVLQRDLLDELIATAVYIPKVAATGPPLQAAVARLRSDLGVKSSASARVGGGGSRRTLADYAVAFGAYGDALKPIATRLRALTAPPILKASLDAERRALTRSIALCATIRDSIAARKIPAANAAIQALFTVSATLNGTRTQREQAAAARAYNARVRRIDTVASRIARERLRLVKLVG